MRDDSTQARVREFHEAFGHPVAEVPTLLTLERAKARVKWTIDEVEREFIEAIEAADIVGAYDALIDARYFIEGTAVEMGLDLDAGFGVVHGCNMAKLGPDGKPVPPDADGKVQKPEGWEPPEAKLAVLIEKQAADGQIYLWARDAANAYLRGETYELPAMRPAQMVKVMQGVSVILNATDKAAFRRWADEWAAS
ncbi:MazG-like nucleotide pyrophosphohydrolase [Microbacterium phage Fizzles]|nr:MazG-like nucleotide pyrophosphohydrolase [Microbacterium phage Fizzles]